MDCSGCSRNAEAEATTQKTWELGFCTTFYGYLSEAAAVTLQGSLRGPRCHTQEGLPGLGKSFLLRSQRSQQEKGLTHPFPLTELELREPWVWFLTQSTLVSAGDGVMYRCKHFAINSERSGKSLLLMRSKKNNNSFDIYMHTALASDSYGKKRPDLPVRTFIYFNSFISIQNIC